MCNKSHKWYKIEKKKKIVILFFFLLRKKRVWEQIIKDNQSALILEDDVIFKSDFLDQLKQYKSDLEGFDYHLLYLWRMVIYEEENSRFVGKYFIKPKFSYSCAAYVIFIYFYFFFFKFFF